jgi:hypothetical protein
MTDLEKLIADARAKVDAMTPQELRAMLEQQARSVARAEAAFGSDADEAAYSAAYMAGDQAAIDRLNAEGEARVARLDAYYAATQEPRP